MRVDFYHLQIQTLDDVLPKLLENAYASVQKILVNIVTNERVEFINSLLWTYEESSFLPHGSKKDGNGDIQPIWLTSGDDNPNRATIVFWVDGAESNLDKLEGINRILNIFDGNSENAVLQARRLWKSFKEAGHEVYYWQQDSNKRWQQKA